ncbi:glutamate--cysteine ligase [Arsenicicoccus piscis]|nr:glutamate--cysteine ligase [Arsenicicoccus piscis]MCH8629020.1 glutamate--cysteine ligase [Arsenicicoccus piscis]
MGEQISSIVTRRERQQYREKVQQCLDVFARMLSSSHFEDTDPMVGLEIELNLVDRELRPSMTNESALSVTTEAFQSELGRFNIELNVDPRPLHGDHLRQLEDNLRAELDDAHAAVPDAGIVCVGILPTLTAEAMSAEVLSPDLRYKALNDSILDARGEDVLIDIQGRSGERFSQYFDTIAPEAACTSMQMHLLVSPTDFASYWNAAQAISGVQVALGANSPFLFGNRLWDETRVPLFYQATDTRPPELRNQGVRPRVFFGERWVTSVFDLFEENVRYFPALLPEMSEEDPVAVLDEGGVPTLRELRLHNGTIYRWNRPIYDNSSGMPHLRIENRVLPAGPTIVDTVANSAFYYGLVGALASDDRPLWSRLSFDAAHENFTDGAKRGLRARQYWPGRGEVPVDELVLRHLLPLAHRGLEMWGVDADLRDRYLDIIEGRCTSETNGATWQSDCVGALERRGLSRNDALAGMLERYVDGMHSNEPVHTWELPSVTS